MVDKFTKSPKGEEIVSKINEVIDNLGGGTITVDSALSTTSENPVQNKVITDALPDTNQLSYYGTCSTAAATQAKVVVCEGFTLKTGVSIRVKFTNAQTYNGMPSLNVNSTGDINVKTNGTYNAARYCWVAGEVVSFTYDGTNWIMEDAGIATTSYYGYTKLYTGAGSTSTSTALTPASLNNLVKLMVEPYPIYSTSSTYEVGDRVRYGYQAWECITAITTAEAWNDDHWKEIDPIQTQLDDKQDTITSDNKLSADLLSEGTTNKTVTATEKSTWNNKLDSSAISDMATKTWVGQQGYTSNVGTVTKVNNTSPDSNGNVTISIPSAVTESTVSGWGFTKNVGTITGITMNGSSKGTSGVVNLGTVITAHQDISGKENTSNKVTSLSASSTNTQYPSAKCVYDALQNAGGGATRNIGEIVTSTIPLTDAGLHLLDGALIQGSGVYSAFVTYIAGLRTQYSSLFTTESDWQRAVTQYGVCGKFVYNSTNNTVRLPKITGILEGTTDVTALGNLIEAGLPNITGALWGGRNTSSAYTGAFHMTGNSSSKTSRADWGENVNSAVNFDASRSNSIYGNSDTVQPQTIKVLYYIVIGTSVKTDIQVDIDNIATDLNGKADRDGSNMVSSVKNFDGQWVQSRISLVSDANVTSLSSYDLSSYLPNDGYKYEVILSVQAFTGKTSGNAIACLAGSDLFDFTSSNFYSAIRVVQVRTRTSSNVSSAGTCIIPVGSGRVIKLLTPTDISGVDYSQGVIYANIKGYRRIGTNN